MMNYLNDVAEYQTKVLIESENARYALELEHRKKIDELVNKASGGSSGGSYSKNLYSDEIKKLTSDKSSWDALRGFGRKTVESISEGAEDGAKSAYAAGSKIGAGIIKYISEQFSTATKGLLQNIGGGPFKPGQAIANGANLAGVIRSEMAKYSFNRNLKDYSGSVVNAFQQLSEQGIILSPTKIYNSMSSLDKMVSLSGISNARLTSLLGTVTKIQQSDTGLDVGSYYFTQFTKKYGDDVMSQIGAVGAYAASQFEDLSKPLKEQLMQSDGYYFQLQKSLTAKGLIGQDAQNYMNKSTEAYIESFGALADRIGSAATEDFAKLYNKTISSGQDIASIFKSSPILAGYIEKQLPKGMSLTNMNSAWITENPDQFLSMMVSAATEAASMGDSQVLAQLQQYLGLSVDTLTQIKDSNLSGKNYKQILTELRKNAAFDSNISSDQMNSVYSEGITKSNTITERLEARLESIGLDLVDDTYDNQVLGSLAVIISTLDSALGGSGSAAGFLGNMISSSVGTTLGNLGLNALSGPGLSALLSTVGPIAAILGPLALTAGAIYTAVRNDKNDQGTSNDVEKAIGTSNDSALSKALSSGNFSGLDSGVYGLYTNDSGILEFGKNSSENASSQYESYLSSIGVTLNSNGSVASADFYKFNANANSGNQADRMNALISLGTMQLKDNPAYQGIYNEYLKKGLLTDSNGNEIPAAKLILLKNFGYNEIYKATNSSIKPPVIDFYQSGKLLNIPSLIKESGYDYTKDTNFGNISAEYLVSRARGIDNVPYDGYMAMLHEGEMVIPAKRANYIRTLLGRPLANYSNVKANNRDSSNGFVQGIPEYASGIDYAPYNSGGVGHVHGWFQERINRAIGDLLGIPQPIVSGYRSTAEQARLYKNSNNSGTVAKPGSSMHESGLAADIAMASSASQYDYDKYPYNAITNEQLAKYKLWKPLWGTGAGKPEAWHTEAIETKTQTGRGSAGIKKALALFGMPGSNSDAIAYGIEDDTNGSIVKDLSAYRILSKYAQYAFVKNMVGGSSNVTANVLADNSGYASNIYRSLISSAATQYGVDPLLLYGIMMSESSGNPHPNKGGRPETLSDAHIGLMQLSAAIRAENGIYGDDVWDPGKQLNAAARYLASTTKSTGSRLSGIGGYNTGPYADNSKFNNYWFKVGSLIKAGSSWDSIINQVDPKQSYVKSVYGYAGYTLTPTYMLANGAIVPATPGGVSAVIGEGKHDEAVIPLDKNADYLGIQSMSVDIIDALDIVSTRICKKLDQIIELKRISLTSENKSNTLRNAQSSARSQALAQYKGVYE